MCDSRPELFSPVVVAVHDDLTAGLIEGTLRPEGYRVIRARHGAHVAQIVLQHQARVVVLDLHTTRRTGIEVIRLLLRQDAMQFVRVLALSVQSSAGAEEEARAAGAHDFVSRPFHPGDLAKRVSQLYSLRAVA